MKSLLNFYNLKNVIILRQEGSKKFSKFSSCPIIILFLNNLGIYLLADNIKDRLIRSAKVSINYAFEYNIILK